MSQSKRLEQTQYILANIQTAILLIDKQHRLVWINEAAEQMLRHSNRQLRGLPLQHFVSGQLNSELLTQSIAQQQIAAIEDCAITLMERKFRANVFLTPLETDESALLIEIQSASHSTQIRKDLALQDQSRVSDHLVRNLAHEIKNPLGGIRGAAQLLERSSDPANRQRCTEVIIQEVDRLKMLVDRMLTPNAIEARQPTNIHEVIEKTLNLISVDCHNNIQFAKDYDPSIPEVSLSPQQIQQALLNLIKNAAEALNGEGRIGIRTRIHHQQTIGARQHKLVLRIDIIDNGPGINEDLAKDIFFPTISSKGSSGLGLGIAQSLVQRHKGLIEFESQPGKTCFTILLPVEESE